jgi:hypothetical protein
MGFKMIDYDVTTIRAALTINNVPYIETNDTLSEISAIFNNVITTDIMLLEASPGLVYIFNRTILRHCVQVHNPNIDIEFTLINKMIKDFT